MDGRVTITFESTVAGLKVLRLHCEETEVRKVEDPKGNNLPFELKDKVLYVTLAKPLARRRAAAR